MTPVFTVPHELDMLVKAGHIHEAYKKLCLDLYESRNRLDKENAELKGIKTTNWLTKDIPLENMIEMKIELLMTGDIKSY